MLFSSSCFVSVFKVQVLVGPAFNSDIICCAVCGVEMAKLVCFWGPGVNPDNICYTLMTWGWKSEMFVWDCQRKKNNLAADTS